MKTRQKQITVATDLAYKKFISKPYEFHNGNKYFRAELSELKKESDKN